MKKEYSESEKKSSEEKKEAAKAAGDSNLYLFWIFVCGEEGCYLTDLERTIYEKHKVTKE